MDEQTAQQVAEQVANQWVEDGFFLMRDIHDYSDGTDPWGDAMSAAFAAVSVLYLTRGESEVEQFEFKPSPFLEAHRDSWIKSRVWPWPFLCGRCREPFSPEEAPTHNGIARCFKCNCLAEYERPEETREGLLLRFAQGLGFGAPDLGDLTYKERTERTERILDGYKKYLETELMPFINRLESEGRNY